MEAPTGSAAARPRADGYRIQPGYRPPGRKAIMMFIVSRAIGNPHHNPGDHGCHEIDRTVQRFRDQREAADGDADRQFDHGHAGAGDDRDRRDPGFDSCDGKTHGRGLAAHPSTEKPHGFATANQSQHCLRIIPTLKKLRGTGWLNPSTSRLPSSQFRFLVSAETLLRET
jgi:hypothetical protein